jgi:microcompartment protein PduB
MLNDKKLTEFVGTAVLDTIGLVIANISPDLYSKMELDEEYSSIGLISSRTGAAGQIMAIDEALKDTNCKLLSIELPRDTKGWGGHGNLIMVGAKSVSDARRAVEIALDLTNKHAGELYISDVGHLEFQYSAKAGEVLGHAFHVPKDKAFGFICASPAAIGLVIADLALKSSNVEIVDYMSPSKKTSHSNEIITVITGDASAVKQAVITAREAGINCLRCLGNEPKSAATPYL